MSKGSVTSLIIFLILLILFTGYTMYQQKIEHENSRSIILREEIKKQAWELKKSFTEQEAIILENFWNDSQLMNRTGLTEKHNITNWAVPLTIGFTVTYYYSNGIKAVYESNRSIEVYYPTELIDKTSGLEIYEVRDCACNDLNTCNLINNTNFTWQISACTGINTYKISVYNANMTRNYPHYLFDGECVITC